MIESIDEAKTELEAKGLFVSVNNSSSLLIGRAIVDAGDGLRLYEDACALNRREGEWVAILPARGLLSYEVPGSLSTSVALILEVYEHHRHSGGEFAHAFEKMVRDAQRYTARVRTGSSVAK